ncbi:PfkB family carbohydrate kinase [Actinacidiphila acidipaludis]|uniref:Sugar kinase n=1 Tax=Actinacidiphila acidipaludis TaxID=2873382 RepID=A0ABS7Q091_9ACTN|nr:PfkB family carbohydrate kinase [Streptomyces acidipaludis]MBY8876316.1 sugar kinase [Streptomyces acidipaludis]
MSRTLYLAGGVLVDLVMRVPRLPARGGDLFAEGAEFTPGGGFNVLTAARRLGLPAVYAGAHGTGPFGDRAREGLAREAVGVLLPPAPDEDTGFCVALVETSERTFVTANGAEGRLDEADIAVLLERLRPGDFVHVSGYGLAGRGTSDALTALVRALPADVLLSFDPGPLADGIPAEALRTVLARADWLSCNRREAGLLTGLTEPAAAAADVSAALRARTAAGLVVRGDADGCWVTPAGQDRAAHAAGRRVEAVDPNGAGDAHLGAFLASLAEGAAPLAAAARANAAAAYAVTRRGPATGPTRAELAAFERSAPPSS